MSRSTDAGSGDRRLTATYVAVILVEIVTLAGLWWFQTTFGR